MKLHSVREADVGMDRVIGVFQSVADERACSVEIVHHTRKAADLKGKARVLEIDHPPLETSKNTKGVKGVPGRASVDVARAYVAAVEGSYQGDVLDPARVGGE